MPRKKFGAIVILVLSAVTMALLAPSVSGQATAPPSSTSSNSTSASAPTPKPRAPTREDVAELKAAMHWPGSTLTTVAIVGSYAEVGAVDGYVGDCILASNKSGKWVQIGDAGGGCFSDADMVEAVPGMPSPVAEAIGEQAFLNEVYWSENAQEAAVRDKNMVAYYDYREQGDEAARRGDFDAAIAAWTKAAALDMGDLISCRDKVQGVEIQAAKDAKARMEQLHLTKSEATAWYEQHRVKLWEQTPCETP